MIFISYVTSLVVMAAFSASLISSLAVQPRHLPFRDLKGLVNDGSYRLGVLQNSSKFSIFDVCLTEMVLFDYILRHCSHSVIFRHCVCVCVCMCVYIYIYIYIYIQVLFRYV